MVKDKKIAISVMFDIVKIEIAVGDDYEAQVLYDDLIERMQSGEGISLGMLPQGQFGSTTVKG